MIDSTITPGDPVATSSLGASVTGLPDPNAAAPSAPAPAPVQATAPAAPAAPAPGGSRLSRIIQAVAGVVSTGLEGIPNTGRPNFVSGLGSGARAEAAAQAYQDEIKFKNFDQQVRIAQIHRQDQAQQQASDDLKAAQQAAQDFQREAFDAPNKLQYNSHPNTGDAVMQTWKADTAANGFTKQPVAGTHLNADGSSINVPSDDPQTLAAQVQKYKALQGVIPFLPSLPQFDPNTVKTQADVDNARATLGKHLDIMTNLLEGHNISGGPWKHSELNDLIPAIQAQRDSLAKNGQATPYQLGTLDHLLNLYKAQEGMHTDAENKAADINAKRKTAQQEELQNNASRNKAANAKPDTNLYEGTDASGNQVAGTSAELQSAGVKNFAKMPALTQTQTLAARELTSPDGLFATARNQIIKLQQSGKLGPVASRWGNFWAQKGLDGDQQAFRGTLGLIATKLMQAHMGNRGGKDAMEHFAGLVPENSTPSALMSELNNEYQYVSALSKRPKVVNNGQ